jgi:hypothetical protein
MARDADDPSESPDEAPNEDRTLSGAEGEAEEGTSSEAYSDDGWPGPIEEPELFAT